MPRIHRSSCIAATFAFLTTYADYVPEVEPEDFDVYPIMLAQPEDDRWTPQHLAELTLKRLPRYPCAARSCATEATNP